jgi:predicted ester cyclase
MTNRATDRGTYRGIPPTGKRVVFGAIWIFRLADGKIAEVWRCADDLPHLRVVADRRCACLS